MVNVYNESALTFNKHPLSNVCYLAKLWKKTKGHRNHQAKNNGSTDMPNRSDYHGVSLDKLCPKH